MLFIVKRGVGRAEYFGDESPYLLVVGQLGIYPYQVLVSGLIPAFLNVIRISDSYPVTADFQFLRLEKFHAPLPIVIVVIKIFSLDKSKWVVSLTKPNLEL